METYRKTAYRRLNLTRYSIRTLGSLLSISRCPPSPKDILSEEQLMALASEFMEKFDYGNQPYIIWLHEDINRKHLHIVSVRINEKGIKIDHNKEAIRAQKICREMEVRHGLHPTISGKGEKELLHLQKVDYPKGKVKEQVKHAACTLLECYNVHLLGVQYAFEPLQCNRLRGTGKCEWQGVSWYHVRCVER